ncbi:MAG: hypothetical protein FJZ56_06965 [Chlamydiae bacterium]|nr:hypothetical protein [Chlamydiota bacterium]MBM3202130.1 hypothetical protein [Chlamydiota bacterium]
MHNEPQKLPPLLGPLSCFLKEALQETDLSSFFHIVCEAIMPFISQNSLLEPIRKEFETQRQEHLDLISRLEKATKRQVHDSYKKLVACLKGSEIVKGEYFSKCLSKIDGLVNNATEERYYTPNEYEIAYEYMKDLCCEVVEKSYGHLIQEFVDIAHKNKHIENLVDTRRRNQLGLLKDQDMASFTHIQNPYVERVKFAPALRKLQDERFLLSDLESEIPWVVYNHLCTAYWSWSTSKSYFTDKSLRYETPLNRARSMLWLEQHSCWCEMQAIKKRKHSEIGGNLFSINRYKKHLSILETKITLALSRHAPELYQKQDKNEVPYRYRLCLDYTELWFAIEWEKGRKPDCYLIAKPNHSSSTYEFFKLISKAEAGEMINAPDRTIADLIKRSNLSGEIRKIFFCKSSTYEVKFNGLNILGEAKDQVNVTLLVKEVSKLHQGYRSPEPPAFLLSKPAVKSTS